MLAFWMQLWYYYMTVKQNEDMAYAAIKVTVYMSNYFFMHAAVHTTKEYINIAIISANLNELLFRYLIR